MTALGVLCCFALFVCLTLLASFFLPSHLSFKNMYIHYTLYTCTCIYMYMYIHARVERCARIHSISRYFGGITRQSRVVFSRVFAFSRPNTVRTRVISPIDGRETARKRSDNINTFYVLFAPAREFIRETA